MRSTIPRLPALGAIALAIALAPGAVTAAEEVAVLDVDVLQQDVRAYVARTGGEVMKHIEEAQKLAATTTDVAGATRHTQQALALVQGAENASPTARLRQAIGELLHHHRLGKAKADGVLPVEAVLNEVSQVRGIDVAAVRTSVGRAKSALEKGDSVEAEAALVEAYQGVGYLEIDLPLQATEARLTAARVALGERDLANANGALSDALNHTRTWTAMVETTEVEEVAD